MYPEDVGTPATHFEIHEFPVPVSGDCTQVGPIFPVDPAGKYTTRRTDATSDDVWSSGALQIEADGHGTESLFYNGEMPVPVANDAGTGPAVQLTGANAIQGRSFVVVADPDCRANVPDDAALCAQSTESDCNGVAGGKCTWVSERPACGTISYSGQEWETVANFTMAGGPFGEKIRGMVVFSQVTTRGSESDTTVYIELEATDEWDATDGSPTDNGCDDDNGDYVSCGHKMHIHQGKLDPSVAATGACDSASVGGHFNIAAGKPAMEDEEMAAFTCTAGADGSPARAASCHTGDITGKFLPTGLSIGKATKPSKYFFVDKFDKLHSILLKGRNIDIGDKSIVLHAKQGGTDRVACADIPISYPWEDLTSLGR